MTVEEIIEKFGGTGSMAKKLSISPSTISTWKKRNRIPLSALKEILAYSKEHRLGISADQLLGISKNQILIK